MTEVIAATAIETRKPTRPSLWICISEELEDGHFNSTDPERSPEEAAKRLPGGQLFFLPGSDEEWTVGRVREIAEKFSRECGWSPEDIFLDDMVKFARALGVLPEKRT